MKDKQEVIEFLVNKYGYASRYPTIFNRRIRKAIGHFLLFYDGDKERLTKENIKIRKKMNDYQSWIYKFICENGLEDKYVKECTKELLV